MRGSEPSAALRTTTHLEFCTHPGCTELEHKFGGMTGTTSMRSAAHMTCMQLKAWRRD